ncbi:hypothetical protein [Paraburkholderia sp. SOS3]|jgi:hypothetical protein|uniref:hypothetical protein n=1 Tax=Paraburkholderia sp. SOS3 TaxID=1926494 RepID=UPI0009477331|nr:hypothetical protein [Paraburkholderia sp. SOS3]APR36449.1 hypothetical protein BTO02_14630 [Paraburkholderia sp. SOS3]
MSDDNVSSQTVDHEAVGYEGFEIHVSTRLKRSTDRSNGAGFASADAREPARYTYIGYVCHPGATVALPGHTVPFHADGDDAFATAQDAYAEALNVGRSIIDGTHPDLSVLSLVTSGA